MNKWIDQGPTLWSGTIDLIAGEKVPFLMEYYENGGGATAEISWSGPGISQEVIPSQYLYTPDSTQPPTEEYGLQATIFDNANFTGAEVQRVDQSIAFDWDNGSPEAIIGPDQFSIRWEGRVEAPTTGTYTFYTYTDDGVRLWINGQLLVDQWVDQGPTLWSGSIALTAGEKVPLVMEYYENGGGAVAELTWSGPSISQSVIGVPYLFLPAQGQTSNSNGPFYTVTDDVPVDGQLNVNPLSSPETITNAVDYYDTQEDLCGDEGTSEVYTDYSQQLSTYNTIIQEAKLDIQQAQILGTESTAKVIAYPNPIGSQQELFVLFAWPVIEKLNIQLLDIHGKSIQSQQYQLSDFDGNVTLKLKEVPQGIYFLNIIGANQQHSQRIVVQ